MLCAGALAAPGSVSAAQGTTVAVTITSTPGPITSCPINVMFSALITVTDWPTAGPKQVQFKWLSSFNGDANAPVQTVTFQPPAGAGATFTATQSVSGSVTEKQGSYWVAAQIVYPITMTAPQRSFVITCPTPGSLEVPLTMGSGLAPGVLPVRTP